MRPKRTHREAFEDVEMETEQIQDVEEGEASDPMSRLSEQEREEKEQQVFNAIKEEYCSLIDQFPLALQREMSLMRELDQQVQGSFPFSSVHFLNLLFIYQYLGYYEDLIPTMRSYIAKRLHLVEPLSLPALTSTTPTSTPERNVGNSMPFLKRLKSTISLTSPHTPGTPMGLPKERLQPPKTNVEMLSHVAFLCDEIVRASEEKVHLAQSSCDSIDRYERLLDQAIKEEEAALSLGARPGTHVAPIILPDLLVPVTNPRNTTSLNPFEDSDDEELETIDPLDNLLAHGPVAHAQSSPPTTSSKKKKSKQKAAGAAESEKLTIRVPAKLPPAQVTVEPTDQGTFVDLTPYCFCQQPSFGEMIMCDESTCEYEWFHLGCVQLEVPPPEDAKWYCTTCLAKGADSKTPKSKNKKKRRR
ncbi:hypothetical protein DL96DRAFT_440208 [Flagelloscypha sp. PMI_526]|nr:hypothetical protein DL96DRAFT_440208 [Flagelloscypha sp. PMI_526]